MTAFSRRANRAGRKQAKANRESLSHNVQLLSSYTWDVRDAEGLCGFKRNLDSFEEEKSIREEKNHKISDH